MALLTFAKVYGLQNNKPGRMIARELASLLVEGIKEKVGNRSAFEPQILFDDRLDERPGFRLKVSCRSSKALAEALDLPMVDGKRRGRTVGGRDAFVIDLQGMLRPRRTMTEAVVAQANPTLASLLPSGTPAPVVAQPAPEPTVALTVELPTAAEILGQPAPAATPETEITAVPV